MQAGSGFKTVLKKTTSFLIRTIFVFAIFIAVLLAFLRSWQGFYYDEHLNGPYYLTAINDLDEMALYYEDSNARIGPTVFAAGWSEDYIVVKRYPYVEKTVTEYYYLIRALDHGQADGHGSVRGPFSETEFMKEKERLNLPGFSTEIEALK